MLYCGWTYLPLVAKPTVVGYKLNIILIYGILSGMLYIRVYIYICISNYVLWYTCIIQVEWYSIDQSQHIHIQPGHTSALGCLCGTW